jgi:hypothetical protein
VAGGRFNHYLFDLNRDWSWATQPETRARLATWWEWNPQVHVDFHEMGYNTTYFFFPAAAPINPIYPPHVLEWGALRPRRTPPRFDARGWPYYTGEAFDLFYPGYGDSWPSLTGAVGMTYEQAGHGAAGLAIEQRCGRHADAAPARHQHRTAGHATLRAAAAGKSGCSRTTPRGSAPSGAGEPDFLLVPGEDPAAPRRWWSTCGAGDRGGARRARLPRGRERVPRLRAARAVPGRHLPGARPPAARRLAATLLQPETELRAEYSYDVSAWSLPYAYGVAAYRGAGDAAGAGWSPVRPAAGAPRRGPAEPARFGYLVAPGDRRPGRGALPRWRAAGARARPRLHLRGARWPAGTWFIPARGNDTRAGAGDPRRPGRPGGAGRHRAERGRDRPGERQRGARGLPRVALVSGEGVSPTSFGAHWFFLEQQLGLPFDAVLGADLATLDLSEYDVIVLPDASARAIGAAEER